MVVKKKEIDPKIKELRELLKQEKVIIGTDRTMKMLKTGKLAKVFLSSNCPNELKEQVKAVGALGEVGIVEMENSNEEIGEICKKPFSISLIGIIK